MQSVQAQTCGDWEHVIIYDAKRAGIQRADRALGTHKGAVRGRYVYILDDDCRMLDEGFVAGIKAVAESGGTQPDLVMVKTRRPAGPPSNETIFPAAGVWGYTPKHGTTNCLCYVARSALWQKHIDEFGRKPWGGDWWFLAAMLPDVVLTVWLPLLVSESRQLGRGKLFETDQQGWLEPLAERYGFAYEKRADVWRAHGR